MTLVVIKIDLIILFLLLDIINHIDDLVGVFRHYLNNFKKLNQFVWQPSYLNSFN